MTALPILAGTHLVVGAGEVGSATATLLADSGADVVLVSRSGRGPIHPAIRRVAADASRASALLAAAPDAVVVYNCVNPVYTRWEQDWPPMAEAFLAYAERTGAVLAVVSNLYGYGPVDVPMTEDLPLAATGHKAAVRIAMWRDQLAAHQSGRIRMTEVRGSDYLCPGVQSMFGDRVMPRLLTGRGVQLIGDLDAPHTWTTPADVARTLITVAADPRGHGRAWHVPSNAPRSQRQVVADLAAAAGMTPPKVSAVPGAVLRALSVVQPMLRELRETDYQRTRPYVLDDSAARTTFGPAPTPWDEVIAGQVAAYQDSATRVA
ncbi:MAG: NAD-dependent epimerase/dehydratase family protein [Actinomycetales bacterium]|nr:NAD-dependent epimerase/dehydratase family protein [Actinomycetales bacterium]